MMRLMGLTKYGMIEEAREQDLRERFATTSFTICEKGKLG